MGNTNSEHECNPNLTESAAQLVAHQNLRQNADPGFHEIRRRNRRGRMYTRLERKRALLLLNAGHTSRRVAAMIGPPCSSSTVNRWRQQRRRKEEYARRRRFRGPLGGVRGDGRRF